MSEDTPPKKKICGTAGTGPVVSKDDAHTPSTLHCTNCNRKLPKYAKCEIYGNYVIVKCPACHLMTPFQFEATA
jgi:phage FluMu protein Com